MKLRIATLDDPDGNERNSIMRATARLRAVLRVERLFWVMFCASTASAILYLLFTVVRSAISRLDPNPLFEARVLLLLAIAAAFHSLMRVPRLSMSIAAKRLPVLALLSTAITTAAAIGLFAMAFPRFLGNT